MDCKDGNLSSFFFESKRLRASFLERFSVFIKQLSSSLHFILNLDNYILRGFAMLTLSFTDSFGEIK